MRIAASIVLFREIPRALGECLESLGRQRPGFEAVYILGNAFDDGVNLRHGVPLECPPVRPFFTGDNLGFAGGHNRNLAEAFRSGADAVMVLNADVRLGPEALFRLVAASDSLDRNVLLGPVLMRWADPGEARGVVDSAGIRWTRDARHFDALQGETLSVTGPPIETCGISGAALFVTAEAYGRVVDSCGEFFDDAFLAYREDAELGLRARVIGIRSLVVPSAHGEHVRAVRGATRGTSSLADLLGVQNRFLIKYKWGRERPGFRIFAAFRDVLVVLAVLVSEKSSKPGLERGRALRGLMRHKRRYLRTASGDAG